MPLLATEAAELSNNDLVRGVVQEIIDIDQVFQFLPFVQTVGKAYVYNRENTLASAQFISTNVDVPESASSFTEVSTTLRIIAGDVDVDNFLAESMSDINAQKAIQIALKAKAVGRLFSNKFITGDETTSYDLSGLGGGGAVTLVEFNGLDKLTDSSMVVTNGTNGGPLSFDKIDETLDKIKLGADVIIMSRRTVRDYKKLVRALSEVAPEFVQLDNGTRVMAYSGKPVLLNDFVPDTNTVGASTDCSTVYAVRFNEQDGVHAIYSGPDAGMRVVDIGQLQSRDATRMRIKWYVALALKSTLSLAKLTGVRDI
jgi:hypothetical protein